MSHINKLFQHYVGYDIVSLIKDEIITEELSTILNKLKTRNIITSYDFKIVPFYAKGEVKVYLNLMTCYMVKAMQICSVINVEFAEEE